MCICIRPNYMHICTYIMQKKSPVMLTVRMTIGTRYFISFYFILFYIIYVKMLNVGDLMYPGKTCRSVAFILFIVIANSFPKAPSCTAKSEM